MGLYHLAWEVGTLAELADVRQRLSALGALVGASDHRVSKSLYAKDPSGIEFEVMWRVPAEDWAAETAGGAGHRPAGPRGRDRPLGRPGHRRRGRLGDLTRRPDPADLRPAGGARRAVPGGPRPAAGC